ncbi:NeuD/PglB/VioB family sugar acetyltransferase [Kribbia dieselivorans]|uniref:NeuD/PglB/VioB family sugar acetyltransferase n=1 Tax=Kribbia dieselivorans TaxID=331526 RepID=UPI000837AE68|nr:NeuD/PglB/VioB family sugar acetyltransferase [Kribbia dieselivorans]
MSGLLLVAASGLARETAAAARATGVEVFGCLDDDEGLWGSEVAAGLPVLGPPMEAMDHPDAALVVCAGKGVTRARLVERLSAQGVGLDRYATVVHPSAALEEPEAIGAGSIVLAGCVFTADVTVGRHVVCMPTAVVTHDCALGAFATLCAGVVLGGGVTVHREAYVGMGASVREGVSIGVGATIGMGSVVLRDVPAGETWAGVPARRLS